MAWHKSRIKRLKQSEVQKGRNTTTKRKLRQLNKDITLLLKDQKNAEAKELLPKITKMYHTAAKKGVIHTNNASRHISTLTNKINKATA